MKVTAANANERTEIANDADQVDRPKRNAVIEVTFADQAGRMDQGLAEA